MKFIILLVAIWFEAEAAPYSPVGCFTDQRYEWVFFWWWGGGMNANQCSDTCEGQHFRYFGMAGGGGKDCHCGSGGYDRIGPSGGCTGCNVNGQWFTCGASNGDPWRLVAVYQLTSATTKMDERYIGCWGWVDPKGIVGSPVQVGSGMMTVTQCLLNCKEIGKPYAGVMNNGTECYCGNDLQWWNNGPYPAVINECFHRCEDENKPCGGGGNRISLYRAVCLEKQYGPDCLPCNCMNAAQCDTTSGVCPGPCDYGWMTINASSPCNIACLKTQYGPACSPCNCLNAASCDKISGVCPGPCDFGWMAINASSPCNVVFSLGLYTSMDNCNDSPIWQPNLNLTSLRDGITSTCVDTSKIHSDTWRMLWKLDKPKKFQSVTIIYSNIKKCVGMNMAMVSVNFANCYQLQSCPGEDVLSPKAMKVPNECVYTSFRNIPMFSDSVYFEFAGKVNICEIKMS